MCECNDYSLLTANSGAATINTANSSLTGSGVGVGTVLTAGVAGGILKSVIIKAAQQTTAGMVRLFIVNGLNSILIDEIVIPEFPRLKSTPTPAPVLPVFVAYKVYNLNLGAGDILKATTQNAEAFNIIGECLDVSYPDPAPDVCCNFQQNYPVSGLGIVSQGNSSLDGTGQIQDIFEAPASRNGTVVKSISISALQSTSEGMIRLFMKTGGTYYLMNEIYVPQTLQSSSQPAFKIRLNQEYNLKTGFTLAASTQNSQSFAIDISGVAWKYA